MDKIKSKYRTLIHLLSLIWRVSWFKFFRSLDSKADLIIWIRQDSGIANTYDAIWNNQFLNDLALIQAALDFDLKFSLKIGPKIGSISGKHIFYTISSQFNSFGLNDHTKIMRQTIQALEEQGNFLYPPSHDAMYWENKAHMHQEFERLEIHTPKSIVFRDVSDLNPTILFPALLKETHSAGSAGVIKVPDLAHLKEEVAIRKAQGQNEFILQELLNIRRDLRVIIVGDEIVLHYWRINKEEEWRPTSTGHGSTVDFLNFPARWRDEILSNFKKLKLITGAFDIAWQNDDLDSFPVFLEVSPAYMPNPPIRDNFGKLTYAEYKKVTFPRPLYILDYQSIAFSIKKKVVNNYLKIMRLKQS